MMAILAMAAAVTASTPEEVAARNSADLQVLYDQSCRVRAYGSYDDMCSKLRKRIKEFERDQARAARERRQGGSVGPVAVQSASAETPTSQRSPAISSGGDAQ